MGSLAVTHLKDPSYSVKAYYDDKRQTFVEEELQWHRSCRMLYDYPPTVKARDDNMQVIYKKFSIQEWQNLSYYEKSIVYHEAWTYD